MPIKFDENSLISNFTQKLSVNDWVVADKENDERTDRHGIAERRTYESAGILTLYVLSFLYKEASDGYSDTRNFFLLILTTIMWVILGKRPS